VKSGKGKPSSLDNRVSILTWDRNLSDQVDEADALELCALQRDLRLKYYFTASSANPWNKSTFTKWRHVVEASVLQAMQTAYKGQEDDSLLRNVYGAHVNSMPKPDPTGQTNVQGLAICHPIILDSPWAEPDDLEVRVLALAREKKADLVDKATAEDVTPETRSSTYSGDREKAKGKLSSYVTQVTILLRHMYIANPHTLHVLLWDLFPGARDTKIIRLKTPWTFLKGHLYRPQRTHTISHGLMCCFTQEKMM